MSIDRKTYCKYVYCVVIIHIFTYIRVVCTACHKRQWHDSRCRKHWQVKSSPKFSYFLVIFLLEKSEKRVGKKKKKRKRAEQQARGGRHRRAATKKTGRTRHHTWTRRPTDEFQYEYYSIICFNLSWLDEPPNDWPLLCNATLTCTWKDIYFCRCHPSTINYEFIRVLRRWSRVLR